MFLTIPTCESFFSDAKHSQHANFSVPKNCLAFSR